MDMGDMKNIIVLKNLPSNLIDEAIVVLKKNQKVKRYQYIESDKKQSINNDKNHNGKETKPINRIDYIVKEAESIISHYITNLETKSPKWKNNMKKLEIKYKQSVRLNFLLGFITVIAILIGLI